MSKSDRKKIKKTDDFKYSIRGNRICKTKIFIRYKFEHYKKQSIGNYIFVDDIELFKSKIESEFNLMLKQFHSKFRPSKTIVMDQTKISKEEADKYKVKFPHIEWETFPVDKFIKLLKNANIDTNTMPAVNFYSIHIPFVTLYFALSFNHNFELDIIDYDSKKSSFFSIDKYWKKPYNILMTWPKSDKDKQLQDLLKSVNHKERKENTQKNSMTKNNNNNNNNTNKIHKEEISKKRKRVTCTD